MRQYFADNRTAPCSGAAQALNTPRPAARRAIKEDLKYETPRQVTAQRAKPVNMTNRLEACQKWYDQIQPGELGVAKIYFADAKHFRLGACAGGNQKFAAHVNREPKKSQAPDDIIPQEDGRWKGGVSAMVSLGLCHRRKGALHSVPSGTEANATEYLNAIKNIYEPDFHQYYGIPPDCISQQDWASPGTSNTAQEYCRREFPMFRAKWGAGAELPDQNPLDYICRGYLQKEVTEKEAILTQ